MVVQIKPPLKKIGNVSVIFLKRKKDKGFIKYKKHGKNLTPINRVY